MDLFRFDPPQLDDALVRRIGEQLYGITGPTTRLRGERSLNTRFDDPERGACVLRIHSAGEPATSVECPARALDHLAGRAPDLPVARVIPSRGGDLVPSVELGGLDHRVRLESYLDGVTFADDQQLSLPALRRIGSLLGSVAAALADFDHPGADGFVAWDIANGLALDESLRAAVRPEAKAAIERAMPRLERAAAAMVDLPRQVIHNDGHAGNLLRSDAASDVVTGLIDFGDLVRTVRAADLAVSGASLVPHQADPVAALGALTDGYGQHVALDPDELAVLPDLVTTRLVLSTLLIQYQIDHAPHIVRAVTPERDWTLQNLTRWLDV